MKKKLIVVAVIALAIAFAGYRYLYKAHRDIASEDANFTITSGQLQSEFNANSTASNAKYADKTIAVSGKVTAVENESNSIVIDGKVSVAFASATDDDALTVGDNVKIKGRFVGYDDLLEEFKIDQSTLIK